MHPIWLKSDKRKVLATEILPGKLRLNLSQKVTMFPIFLITESKFFPRF